MTALLVALFGALGSLSRYLLAGTVQRAFGRLPAGTFTVNVLGSLAIGFAMAIFTARGTADRERLAVTAGFLGGFTTYSAFALETWNLLEQRSTGAAALYVTLTVGVCLAACAGGVAIGRAVAG